MIHKYTKHRDHTWKKYIPQGQTAQEGRDQKNEMIQISEPQTADKKVAFVPSELQRVSWMMSHED